MGRAKATSRASAASRFDAVLGIGRGVERELVISSAWLPLTQSERASVLVEEFPRSP
jgi:hypothetical protein